MDLRTPRLDEPQVCIVLGRIVCPCASLWCPAMPWAWRHSSILLTAFLRESARSTLVACTGSPNPHVHTLARRRRIACYSPGCASRITLLGCLANHVPHPVPVHNTASDAEDDASWNSRRRVERGASLLGTRCANVGFVAGFAEQVEGRCELILVKPHHQLTFEFLELVRQMKSQLNSGLKKLVCV